MVPLSDDKFDGFVRAYRASLVLPQRRGPLLLLCPIGIIGSGKTTVMRPLALRLGLVRVCNDDIRRLLYDAGFDYERTNDIAYAVIRGLVDEGLGVAIDADCVKPDIRERIANEAVRAHLPVVWVHVNPPESFIVDKLTRYPHTWLFRDAEHALANYRARKPLHADLGDIPFVYTFDPSRPDLGNQIEEAALAIEQSPTP